jgi:hypothetical protein
VALVLLHGPVSTAVAEPRVAVIDSSVELVEEAGFLGLDDETLLRRMCDDAITSLEPLGQGTTVKFKARFDGELKAAIRPAQKLAAGNFRADLAAYRLSRALQLGTVPPACQRMMGRADLAAAAGPKLDRRLADEVRWSDDLAPASVTYWVTGVKSADLEKNRRAWRALLVQGADLDAAPALVESAAEGSRLLVWDFLIANWDRWSGANTFRLGVDGPFVWLDNAAGFGPESGKTRKKRVAELRRVERFSRRLIDSLRAATDDDLRAALAPASLPERSVRDLLERRRLLIGHVDALVAEHGEEAVLAFD